MKSVVSLVLRRQVLRAEILNLHVDSEADLRHQWRG
jgi:hypothetical protein